MKTGILMSALILLSLFALSHSGCRGQKDILILGSDGSCRYQLVLPGGANEAVKESACLVREAFGARGFDIPVVTEEEDDDLKPGIYLGDTEFARNNGISPEQFRDWSYLIRVVGNDLIISGSNKEFKHGVVKGICDFLRLYAGTRFLYPGETGIEYLDIPRISVPASLDLAVTPILKFNYMKNVLTVNYLYKVWKINRDRGSLFRLLGAIDHLNAMFDNYYSEEGEVLTIPGWPEMLPFRNTGRSPLGSGTDRHWGARKAYMENPFKWYTQRIRDDPSAFIE